MDVVRADLLDRENSKEFLHQVRAYGIVVTHEPHLTTLHLVRKGFDLPCAGSCSKLAMHTSYMPGSAYLAIGS